MVKFSLRLLVCLCLCVCLPAGYRIWWNFVEKLKFVTAVGACLACGGDWWPRSRCVYGNFILNVSLQDRGNLRIMLIIQELVEEFLRSFWGVVYLISNTSICWWFGSTNVRDRNFTVMRLGDSANSNNVRDQLQPWRKFEVPECFTNKRHCHTDTLQLHTREPRRYQLRQTFCIHLYLDHFH